MSLKMFSHKNHENKAIDINLILILILIKVRQYADF